MTKLDAAYWGTMRWGSFRWGVFSDEWDQLLASFEGKGSCDVTRRKLVLTTPRDSVTGWYNKTWTEDQVKGVFVPRASAHLASAAGGYVRLDATVFLADGLRFGDEVKTANREYYEVKGVRPHYTVGGDSFSYRECDLAHLQMHSLSYSNLTPSVNSAQYQTKLYWDTYISIANLNNHAFTVCYANPDYPLTRVFLDKGIHIVFAVGVPETASLPFGIGYIENVPIYVMALDPKLQWLGEAELRRIIETYPLGSLRTLERISDQKQQLGSTTLYSVNYVLRYKRYA